MKASTQEPLALVTRGNSKVGRMPTLTSGPETCPSTCPFNKGKGCYWRDNGLHFSRCMRAVNWLPFSVALALWLSRAMRAGIGRLFVGGDVPNGRAAEVASACKAMHASGFAVLGFTAKWNRASSACLAPYLRASCQNKRMADRAVSLGFKPALTAPSYAEGRLAVVSNRLAPFDCKGGCKGCQACDVRMHSTAVPIFTVHGPCKAKTLATLAKIRDY